MRPSFFLGALGLLACGGDRRPSSAEPSAAAAPSRGPDPVLLRVPRAGGRVAASVYPRLDSVVWRSGERAPALARVLAFDAERGVLAAVDTQGRAVRVDLRLGTVRTAGKVALGALAAFGSTFYGVDAAGAVTRLTPTGGPAWTVDVGGPVELLVPQRDGSLLAAGARAGTGRVWTLRPPGTAVADSATVAGGTRPLATGGRDRVYFAASEELAGVQARGLTAVAPIALQARVRAAAATPSGDRLYVTTERAGEVAVVDRYAERVSGRLTLPGTVGALRMDPVGRYLLVRAARGDSAWVVAVGDDRVVGTLRGAWREDLPLVLPDGMIVTAQGADVALVSGETLRPVRTVAGGAADLWHLVQWNGFRPRAAGLDQPVTFEGSGAGTAEAAAVDSATLADSAAAPVDSAPAPAPDTASAPAEPVRPTVPPPTASAARRRTPTRTTTVSAGEVEGAAATPAQQPGLGATRTAGRSAAAPVARGFTVQYAAAETEDDARRILRNLRVARPAPRVVPSERDGKTFYRVVSGPYATRAAADAAGRSSGASYWIYAGAP